MHPFSVMLKRRLRPVREAAGLTQLQLAQELGWRGSLQAYVSLAERGRAGVPRDRARELARWLRGRLVARVGRAALAPEPATEPKPAEVLQPTVCLEAHELLATREQLYGPMATTWEQIAQLADQLTAPTDTPGQRAVLSMVVVKLVRRKHSPSNRDHTRDACGYLGILDRLGVSA